MRFIFSLSFAVWQASGLGIMHQFENTTEAVEEIKCRRRYGVNWDQWRVNISFYLDIISPNGVHFVPNTDQLTGMLEVLHDMREHEDGGLSCPLAVATTQMLRILPECGHPEVLWLDLLSRPESEQLTRQALAAVGAINWSLMVEAKWHFFRFLVRLKRYFMEISHDFLSLHGDISPPPPTNEQRRYLLHIEHALKHGLPMDVPWASRILNSYGTFTKPCGDPTFGGDVLPTPEEVVCLNQVMMTSVATLALADFYSGEGNLPLRRELIDRAFGVISPWLAGVEAATPILVFLSRWPLFEMLDRIECSTSVRIRMPPASKRGDYYSTVFPFREKVSNFVRACEQPYCEHNFFEFMESLRDIPNTRLIEVGSNLGDCALWSATMYDMPVVAFEPLRESARAFRSSVIANGLESHVTVHETALGGRVGQVNFYQVGKSIGNAFAWSSSTNPYDGDDGLGANATIVKVNISTLNQFVPVTNTNDIIKMWAFNDSLDILRGGSNLLAPNRKAGSLAAIWIGLFVDYHGADLYWQVQEYFNIFEQNGLNFTSCPFATHPCDTPEDVMRASETNGIFPLVASRTPAYGLERDLFEHSGADLPEEFVATKRDGQHIQPCGFSLSQKQIQRLHNMGIDNPKSAPISFL
eukprot:gene233-1095_t